jgi:hypothetical protein
MWKGTVTRLAVDYEFCPQSTANRKKAFVVAIWGSRIIGELQGNGWFLDRWCLGSMSLQHDGAVGASGDTGMAAVA